MGFQVSPGVNVTEIDLTTIVPAVSTTEGAIAGVFRWGPIEDRELISNEDQLVARFGRPTSDNFETFFTAANFLAYGNKLYVSRAADSNTYNAVANTASYTVAQIKNATDYDGATIDANVMFMAKYGGAIGNSLRISVCDSASAYSSNVALTDYSANVTFTVGQTTATIETQDSANATALAADMVVGDNLLIGNTTTGQQYLKITAIATDGANVGLTFSKKIGIREDFEYTTDTLVRYWEFHNYVDAAPGQSTYVASINANTAAHDEIHVVVVDEDGLFTNTPNQILEVWSNMSRATDARGEQGGSNYYKTILNLSSKYVWYGNDRSGAASSTSASITASSNVLPYSQSFIGGTDGTTESNVTLGALYNAYDQFKSAEDIDISLIVSGKARGTGNATSLANYIIENICETRKDCIVFVSPDRADVVNVPYAGIENMITFRNDITSTSYAVIDSGYKYQYDRYNDVYRWVPLNGDVAGTVVRTDDTRDPWFSPAGFNRGQIKNVVKLAVNPNKAERDQLYKNGINPIVTFPGQGTVLYGDKTALAKPSAFDRINVRRLFIVLEKAIATAAKFTLFEFNDEFTRATFRNLVEPYLRDIQGRRGIYDFRVICDESNNTGEVIDRNEFVGDIYIKPARSINFIQLNFVAVRTGVEFDEVIGKF